MAMLSVTDRNGPIPYNEKPISIQKHACGMTQPNLMIFFKEKFSESLLNFLLNSIFKKNDLGYGCGS